jgi:hypothetical protein
MTLPSTKNGQVSLFCAKIHLFLGQHLVDAEHLVAARLGDWILGVRREITVKYRIIGFTMAPIKNRLTKSSPKMTGARFNAMMLYPVAAV